MEEDIKILENYLEQQDRKFVSEYRLNFLQAIEHLIARNKELEQNYINPSKARFSYYDTDKGTKVVIEGFISKSKVREKIEELEQNVREFEEYWSKDPRQFKREMSIDYYKLEVLKELLED